MHAASKYSTGCAQTAPPAAHLDSSFYVQDWHNQGGIPLSLDRPFLMPLHPFSLFHFLHRHLLSPPPLSLSLSATASLHNAEQHNVFKKHTHFPSWGWNCPKLYPLHNATQAAEKIWINPPPPIFAPIPSRCKIFLIGIASKMRIKAAKLFIPYLSKDLSSPAGVQMETGNPAALLSLHYQLFT